MSDYFNPMGKPFPYKQWMFLCKHNVHTTQEWARLQNHVSPMEHSNYRHILGVRGEELIHLRPDGISIQRAHYELGCGNSKVSISSNNIIGNIIFAASVGALVTMYIVLRTTM
jgi:hypothetical protein